MRSERNVTYECQRDISSALRLAVYVLFYFVSIGLMVVSGKGVDGGRSGSGGGGGGGSTITTTDTATSPSSSSVRSVGSAASTASRSTASTVLTGTVAAVEGAGTASSTAVATSARPPFYQRKTAPDPSRLAPEDALAFSQIRLAARGQDGVRVGAGVGGAAVMGGDAAGGAGGLAARLGSESRRKRDGGVGGAGGVGVGGRRRKVWKKLLWVKQSCKSICFLSDP